MPIYLGIPSTQHDITYTLSFGLIEAIIAGMVDWVAAKEPNLSYHHSETKLFTICPYYSNLHY